MAFRRRASEMSYGKSGFIQRFPDSAIEEEGVTQRRKAIARQSRNQSKKTAYDADDADDKAQAAWTAGLLSAPSAVPFSAFAKKPLAPSLCDYGTIDDGPAHELKNLVGAHRLSRIALQRFALRGALTARVKIRIFPDASAWRLGALG